MTLVSNPAIKQLNNQTIFFLMFEISSIPSHISPYLIHTPWLSIRWYGAMYIVALAVMYALASWRIKHEKNDDGSFRFTITKDQLIDAMMWGFIGLLIGARLVYVLIYDPVFYLAHPLQIIWPYDNGVFVGIAGFAFHGGLIGTIAGLLLFCKKYRINPWALGDLVIPCVPIAYFFGRIGNFLNGELYGRITSVPWAMRFPGDVQAALRHPSQLYEAGLEGLVCFGILWSLRKRIKGAKLLGSYLCSYAIARMIVEYFREPDPQIGFLFGSLTMGQVLSGLMLVAGVILILMKRSFAIGR